MLKLILGPDRLANSREILSRICAAAKEGERGQILIVPEQYSHETERRLCAAGGDDICRYAEVLSFSRLAGRLFSLYGGVSEEYLDKGGRLLTMYLAVQNVRSRIKHYAAVLNRPEFLSRLCGAVEEFLTCALSPDQLLAASKKLNGQFAQKLEELALIYESYLAVCGSGRGDPITRLTRLEQLLRQTDYLAGRTVFLDGFSDFTVVELDLVKALMQGADQVTVALNTDQSRKAIFHTANETVRLLSGLAAHGNIPVEYLTPDGGGLRPRSLDLWLSRLFASGTETIPDEKPMVALHKSSSPEAECAFAAAYIQRHVQNGGRYRDICVAYSDDGTYAPALRKLLTRANIPAYFAGTQDVLQKPLFAAVLAALDAAERYDGQAVLRYLRSLLSPLTTEACDRIHKYAYIWSIQGSQWTEPWTMHPEGFGQAWDTTSQANLAELEAWRETAMAPLTRLRSGLKNGKTVREQLLALDAFLEAVELREGLREQTDLLNREQDLQKAQETAQLYELLIQAMEQMEQVLGEQRMSLEQFSQVFRLLLSQYQVGTIPASLDEVQVGTLAAFRHKQAPILLVLGAEEGKLPAFDQPVGVFSEQERQTLLRMELPLSNAQEEKLDRELGRVYAAFCGATRRVTLCCSGEQPSALFLRTRELLPQIAVTGDGDYCFAADSHQAAARLLRDGDPAEIHSPLLLQTLQELKKQAAYDFAPLSTQTVKGLYGDEIYLSASRIDRFASCKFSFYMNDGIKAKAWKQASFDAPIFGTFVHYVLEKLVNEVMEQGGFAAVSDERLVEIADRHSEVYIKTYMPDMERRGERFGYLLRRSLDELRAVVLDVAQELRLSDFVPVSTELSFQKGGQLPPVRIQGKLGASILSGLVDRVDLYETPEGCYYRIVDYKTGHKDFDYADILCGKGLQMLIYLFALKKHGPKFYGRELDPAGVLYVPARQVMVKLKPGEGEDRLASLRKSNRQRKGLVLGEEALLKAMEHSKEQPVYLPYQIKNEIPTGDVASRGQLVELEKYVNKALGRMTDQMLGGALLPDPIRRDLLHSSCDYCDFKAACHIDLCRHDVRWIRAVKAENFWTEVEGGSQHG